MSRLRALLAVVLAACTGPSGAIAFHDGGAADCAGCHVMHGESGGVGDEALLLGSKATDVCLRCHETAYGNSWGADLLAPGPVFGAGAFIHLLEDNLNDGPSDEILPGHTAGHNVISPEFGVAADPVHGTAPGGSYPSGVLGCTSCHDPHGSGDGFRLLYGAGQTSRAEGYAFVFSADAPDATGISVFGSQESELHHNVYRSGMTDWCGNCHGRYHDSGLSGFDHPSDRALEPGIAGNYNAYEGTGFNNGDGTSSYQPLVPYEDGTIGGTGFTGPARSASRVACISCHRAHASSGPASGRWDFHIETWADEGKTGSFPIPNPYAATAGPNQRTLCEKCHGEGDPQPE